MKNFKKLIVLLLLFCFMGCATQQIGSRYREDSEETIELNLSLYTGPKKIIYVFDIKNKSEFDDPQIGRGLAKMLTTALVESNRFRVVERTPEIIENILQEQKLSLTGVIDSQTAVSVGKLLGAHAVVIGEVSEFGIRKTGVYTGLTGSRTIKTRLVVDARMVDVETGEILAAKSGIGISTTKSSGFGAVLSFEYGTEGFDETSIGIAARKAVYRIVEKFALTVEQILQK
jgi:curli biogenesis system outer membrane secretion channel CsgG